MFLLHAAIGHCCDWLQLLWLLVCCCSCWSKHCYHSLEYILITPLYNYSIGGAIRRFLPAGWYFTLSWLLQLKCCSQLVVAFTPSCYKSNCFIKAAISSVSAADCWCFNTFLSILSKKLLPIRAAISIIWLSFFHDMSSAMITAAEAVSCHFCLLVHMLVTAVNFCCCNRSLLLVAAVNCCYLLLQLLLVAGASIGCCSQSGEAAISHCC